ncbi:MAG: hypothetical protein IPG50_16755 [Myxococcales bacterium]|nr:hypothetical protein [Myxococcales bacterium]
MSSPPLPALFVCARQQRSQLRHMTTSWQPLRLGPKIARMPAHASLEPFARVRRGGGAGGAKKSPRDRVK